MDNQEVWEEIYSGGHNELAPWDEVVSFVYRNAQGNPGNTHILEVGCGTGSNLKFLHDQGFRVYGIDFSKTAIEKSLEKVPIPNRILEGNFQSLPFPDSSFDLVVDRAALWYSSDLEGAISEIYRVLKPGGKFFFTPCHENSDERADIRFVQSEEEIQELIPYSKWLHERLELVSVYDMLKGDPLVSYFRVTAKKESGNDDQLS